MHAEILSENQQALFGLIDQYRGGFYLAGGTAIAMHIGHRRSGNFDLYTYTRLDRPDIRTRLAQMPYKLHIILNDAELFRCKMNEVNIAFFSYPYPVEHPIEWSNIISMPSLLSLAAMKAYALDRESKWADYVDLYFIITRFYSIKEIVNEARKMFMSQFSERLFREQLCFHKDIDYSEEVEYIIPDPPTPDEIKNTLIEKATEIFKIRRLVTSS
jgi:hypothetical protein